MASMEELMGMGKAIEIMSGPEAQAIFTNATTTFVQLSKNVAAESATVTMRNTVFNKLRTLKQTNKHNKHKILSNRNSNQTNMSKNSSKQAQDPGGQVPQPEHRQDRVLGHQSLESLDPSLLTTREILIILP